MKTTVQLIALRTTAYNDRYDILSAYTGTHGSMSFLVPAGRGREAVRRRALLMPLSLVECVADRKPGREICTMSEPRPMVVLSGLHLHPAKNAVSHFLAELLSTLLRDVPAKSDAGLFDFLTGSVRALDLLPGNSVANFHLVFLSRLVRMLGIEPDTGTYRRGYILDLRDGIWRPVMPLHSQWLSPTDSRLALVLSRCDYMAMHRIRLSRGARGVILDRLLEYYGLHFKSLSALRSPEVLKSLFD